ncbi:Proteasome activator BLM10 [Coemansia sp. RSA 371]|nr:Proteasome activator BLM10 [Coemansia sp. RSA 371]
MFGRREDRLTAQDIMFDWRKLYDLVRNIVVPKIWQDNPIQQRSKLKNIVDLICEANRFFPQSAAMEVFEELLPQIQFNSMDRQILTVQLLTLFVPTARPPKGVELVTSGPQSTDPQRWLPTIFSLWSFNLRTSVFDAYLMNLVTTLVLEQRGQLKLTNEQLRFVFASGLHFFNLPVSRGAATLPRNISMQLRDSSGVYRMQAGAGLPLKEERAHSFARFIVYTMHDESSGGTLELFEQLVQMIEPFYHPSNNGAWSGLLARFLRHLAKELLQRSRAEAAEDCEVPVDARLSRSVRRRLVVLVRTLAMLLLFSKGEDSVSMSHSTLKHLAELEPDLIFRPLLDTLYTAIDSVTETHRMISAMRALAKLATTLSTFAHYPEGAQHIAPLLTLTLPGIDVNDPTKSYFALSFIHNLCHNGVVFDELLASGDMPEVRSISKESAEDMDVSEPPELDMNQIEWATRASTAQFEAWIDQYLRRVFALMDNLSSSQDTSNNTNSSADMKLVLMASYSIELVLKQCGSRYYPMISRLITQFVTSITSLSAVEGMHKVVNAFVSALPELAHASLLSLCCERIVEEIDNGVGLTPSLSRFTRTHSETTLIWFATMLLALVECSDGQHLLKYKSQIVHAMKLLSGTCMSRHVYNIGGQMLNCVMLTLTSTTPCHTRSVPDSVWNDAEFRDNHFRHWGKHPNVADDSFSLEWHTPSEQEIEFAQELMREMVEPRIGELAAFIDSADKRELSNTENVELNRLVWVLRCGVRGLGHLVPPPGTTIAADDLTDALVGGDDANGMPPRYRLDRQVPGGYVFTDADSSEYGEVMDIRKRAGLATAQALQCVVGRGDGNVENIKALILLGESVVCYYAVDRPQFTSKRRAWNYGIEGFAMDNTICEMPRIYASRRAQLTQVSRLFHNTRFMPASELFSDISAQIAHLCLSAYSEVRSYAVSALDNIMAVVPQIKYPLIPMFVAELDARDESNPEKMMGALRMLDSLPIRRACLRDWRFFPAMVLALCRAQHEDKPQVKTMIRNTAVTQVVYVVAPVEPVPPGPLLEQMVNALDGANTDVSVAVAKSRETCAQRYRYAASEYTRLVNELVGILRDAGTTWRFAAIAGYYLDQLTSVRTAPEEQLVGTLAEYLTSDLMLFRESAALNLAQAIGMIKKRSKLSNPNIAAAQRRQQLDMRDGRALGAPHAYADLCERALDGDTEAVQTPLVDNPACGWLVWPKTAKVYAAAPTGDALAFDSIEEASRPAYNAVRSVLFADGKWAEIARLFSVESTRPSEEEIFGGTRAGLFSQVFSLFGPPLLERAWTAIEGLARENERVGAQRAAAEMIGGLLRGTKHWAQSGLDAMWTQLIPLLDTVFARLAPDTLRFWQAALQYAFARRDPRRYLPLIRLIVYGRPFDPQAEAPFAEAAKLDILRALFGAWDWRIASAVVASRPRFLDALAHPYKQVRDAAAIAMYTLSSAEFSVSYARVDEAVDDLARYGPLGRDFSQWAGSSRTQALISEMTQRVQAWKAEVVPLTVGPTNFSRGSKTLLSFFFVGFRFGPRRLTLDHAPNILQLLSELQEHHDDDELCRLASSNLEFLSQVLYTANLSEIVGARLLALLDSSMWHVVNKALPLLCTLTFANRFTLSREIRARILDTTSLFLEHDQIEVRQAASSSLTNMVKCASSNVIFDINTRFSAKLQRRLPRVRYGRTPKDPHAYSKLVLTRHAGVLGLSCLVLAFPYTIPEWMPNVLVQLAECIDDPNPIQSTVQRTFAEFRRTHMDTWHEDRKRFSTSQLDILTDMLVSPCYYA